MSSSSFTPKDIPRLTDKVFVITGGTAGLGEQTVLELVAHGPKHVVFTGRNESKAQALIQKIKSKNQAVQISYVKCDLTSLASVQECARTITSTVDHVDVLITNAGVMALPPGLTKDGYELQFATNHLGHALLTKLLMPSLKSSGQSSDKPRIVSLSSSAYSIAPKNGVDFETLKTDQANLGNFFLPGHPWARYGQSKLANLLYARELSKQHPDIMSVSVDPGFIKTELFTNVDWKVTLPVRLLATGRWVPPSQGAWNQLWAATCPESALRSGQHYGPVAKATPLSTSVSKDDALAQRLWDWTQTELARFS